MKFWSRSFGFAFLRRRINLRSLLEISAKAVFVFVLISFRDLRKRFDKSSINWFRLRPLMPSNMMQNQFRLSKLVQNSQICILNFSCCARNEHKNRNWIFPRIEVNTNAKLMTSPRQRGRFLLFPNIPDNFLRQATTFCIHKCQNYANWIRRRSQPCPQSVRFRFKKLLAAACHVLELTAKSPSVVISIIQKHVQSINREISANVDRTGFLPWTIIKSDQRVISIFIKAIISSQSSRCPKNNSQFVRKQIKI